MTFVSPQGLADLALEPRAFNDRALIEPWLCCGSAQTLARDRRARLLHVLDILRRIVGLMFMWVNSKCAHQLRPPLGRAWALSMKVNRCSRLTESLHAGGLSLVSQSDHGIHPGRPPRRKITCGQSHTCEQDRRRRERQRIERSRFKQQLRDQSHQPCGPREPQTRAHADQCRARPSTSRSTSARVAPMLTRIPNSRVR